MARMTRKRLLEYGAAASGAAVFGAWGARTGSVSAAMGGSLRKYIQPVPNVGAGIAVAQQTGANHYSFTQTEIARQLHPDLPATPLWAYDDGSGLGGQAGSFGMAVAAETGTPVTMSFFNDLPTTYPSWIPVDPHLSPFGNEVRVMTHLHGGVVAGDSDGNPWATPGLYARHQTQNVVYPNETGKQPAALSWFHDHGMGTTRLNVFAGLAAAYVIRDQFDTGAAGNANGLPFGLGPGGFEVPLVIQDRQFNPDGTFLYPTSPIPGVTWIGEYFGDVMLVNGKVWPFLEVQPRLYRFRVLNGCNARILNIDMGGARMWQIGAEAGLWAGSVPVSSLVLAPAERADVLVDFSRLAGRTTTIKNLPLRGGVTSPAPQLPQVMQIRVANTPPVAPTIPTTLVGGSDAILNDAPPPGDVRFITLNEVNIDTADWILTLNGDPYLSVPEQGVTEQVSVNHVQDWYYINLTGDTHPMHTHLISFKVVARVPFDVGRYVAEAQAAGKVGDFGVEGGIDPRPYATGPARPLDPTERGFKETVKANPGEFTIIRARFVLPTGATGLQKYVHHCHIVEHEDNEMMRPFTVVA